jgi:hypothetical protein
MEWVAVALGAVDLISGIMGGSSAKRAAKREAKEEARLEGLLTTEKVRQLDVEQRLREGETRAGYASGRVDIRSKSALDIITEQKATALKERQTILEVGASRAANALQRGSNLSEQIGYKTIGDAAGSASNLFTLIKAATG